MDECTGHKVYRLFRTVIDKYVKMFETAEIEWQDRICTHINPFLDFPFVQTLEDDDRIGFWMDKMAIFRRCKIFNRLFLPLIEEVTDSCACMDERVTIREEFLVLLHIFTESEHITLRSRLGCSPGLLKKTAGT